MSKLELDVIGTAVADYDENHLFFMEGDELCVSGVAGLIRRAGGEATRGDLLSAMRSVVNRKERELDVSEVCCEQTRQLLQEHIEQDAAEVEGWRRLNSRQYPPVYRMKIKIELEEVSAEEAEKFWTGALR